MDWISPMLIEFFDNLGKITIPSHRGGEARQLDVALVEENGLILAFVYMFIAIMRCERFLSASRRARKGDTMQKSTKSLTDWDRVRKAYESDAPIPYGPDDGPYDPNDDAAVDAYWAKATILRPNHRGPRRPRSRSKCRYASRRRCWSISKPRAEDGRPASTKH